LGEKYRDSEACARSASAWRRCASRNNSNVAQRLGDGGFQSRPKSIGLVTKSNAPRFIAMRILAISP